MRRVFVTSKGEPTIVATPPEAAAQKIWVAFPSAQPQF